MTIGEPNDLVQEAGIRMIQTAIDLGRAAIRRSPEGIIIQIEEVRAGI